MGMMKPQKVGVEAMEDRVERLAHPEGFSPAGLKVLVVDDDLLCLMILERMLAQCKYTVTTCNSATKALAMLRENRSYFDLVLSDVYMPDMDGFKLLEAIGLELDLPVIMMSGDGETDVVMKGITHGACDYLLKPVRLEELRNIWQHVVRKRVTPRDTPKEELSGEWDESAKPLESDPTEYEQTSSRKRKEKMEDDYQVVEDMNNLKKARVVWSVELHQQFVNAVHQLGVDRAVPRRILDIMNVQGLTRENVASHLQKYRLYLKRLIGVTPQPYPVASFQASEGGKFGGIMQIQPGGRPAASSSNKGVNLRANPAMPLGLGGGGGGGGGQIDSTTLNTLVQLQSLQQKQQAGNGQGGLLANPLHVATTQAQGTPPMVSLGLQRMDSSELDRLMKAQYDAGRQRGERGAANNLAVLMKNNEDLSLFKSLAGQDETKPMLGNHNNNAGSNMMTAMSMSSLRMGEELGGNNAGGLGYIETAQRYNHNKVGSGDFSSSLPFSMGTSLSNGGVSDGSFSSYNDFPGGPEFLSASTPDLSLLGQLEALEQGEGKYHLPAHSSTYPS